MSTITPPSLIEYKSDTGDELRFLIFDAPNDSNLKDYVKEMKKHRVKVVVRVCDPTYLAKKLEDEGIKVYDWPYPDGASPPTEIMNNWRQLVRETFSTAKEKETIGVHCVAGLGRAPVLVAIALIDAGMENLAAIELIRSKRKGAINASQLRFLREYKPPKDKCIVM